MRRLLLAALCVSALAGVGAFAQSNTHNPTCPTRPDSDSSNACASTAFVHHVAGGSSGGVSITAATGITVTPSPITGTGTVGITNTAVTPGTYGDATHASAFTVNQQGQLTAASQNAMVTSITQGNGIVLSPSPIISTGSVSADIATNSNIWGGTTNKLIDAHVAQTSIAPVALTISTATFTPAFGSAINLEITLVHASCPCTIANPTGVYAGASGYMTIIQSATGSDTVTTWGGNWKFAGGTKPTLSTAASAIDTLGYYCRTTTFCEITYNGAAFQ